MAEALHKANSIIANTVLKNVDVNAPDFTDSVQVAFGIATFGYAIQEAGIQCSNLEEILNKLYFELNDKPIIAPVASIPSINPNDIYQHIINFIKLYEIPPVKLPKLDPLENLVDAGNNDSEFKDALNVSGRLRSNLYAPSIRRIPNLAYNVLGYLPPDLPDNSELKLVATKIFPDDPGLAEKCMSYMLQCNYKAAPGTEEFAVDEQTSNTFFESFRKTINAGGDAAKANLKAYLETEYNRLPLENIKPVEELVPIASVEEEPKEEMKSKPSSEPNAPGAAVPTPTGMSPESASILEHMAYDDAQLSEAYDVLSTGTYFATPLITTYHPGITEKAIAQLLDNQTDRGEHRPFRVTAGDPKLKKTVMIPPAFKEDKVPAIWSRAVIGSMGFPFVNFTCPPIMEIIKGTDPKAVKSAYKSVKPLFRQCGLKKPIATLKEFAHAQYRNCSLNAVSVDAEELFLAEPGSTVSAGIIDPYSKTLKVKSNVNLPVDFLTAFFGVLSPVNAVSQYCELSGMDSKSYLDYLAEKGKPPMYILNPKKCSFRRGPKGSLFHELFSSKTAPVLVRARVSSHDGGFIMPEKLADMLLAV